MKRIAAIALAALLSACAGPPKFGPEVSIVPVSLAGNQMTVKYIGITAFGNAERHFDATDWHINDAIEDALFNTIGPALHSRPIAPSAEYRDWLSTPTAAAPTTLPFQRVPGGPEAIQRVAKAAHADYVLVVRENTSNRDMFFATNQAIRGYGLAERRTFGHPRAVDYAWMMLSLFDGHSGEWVWETDFLTAAPRQESEWIDEDHLDLTAQQLDTVRTELLARFPEAAAKVLPDLVWGPRKRIDTTAH